MQKELANDNLAVEFDGPLKNFKKDWNEKSSQDYLTNTNYWLYHLEENLSNLTRKQLSLYDFRSNDSEVIFSNNFIDLDTENYTELQ